MWQFDIEYQAPHVTCTSWMGGTTGYERKARLEAIKMAAYYMELGYTILYVRIRLLCSVCNGSGLVYKDKTFYAPMKPCKHCTEGDLESHYIVGRE